MNQKFKTILQDIDAVSARDPATGGRFEALLCSSGLHAILCYRFNHFLWRKNFRLLSRVLSQIARFLTGIEIHPGAKIGKGFFIDHGAGVVIGETAEIGNNVTLYQNVTLGGTGKHVGKRHPTIGDNVVVGAGARVLGPFTVGEGAKIGASAVVLKEVPPYCTVVGNPGRVVRMGEKKVEIDLDQVHLPDPVKERILSLTARVDELEKCMGCASCEKCPDCSEKETCARRAMKEENRNEDL